MKKYSMTCSCGDVMTVDANSHEEAVAKMKEMMSQDAIDKHMAEKHAGEPSMTKDQVDMMIDQKLKEMPQEPAPAA